ncbi:hypothetical protein ACFYQ5_05990 [Streptomyces sp. NPDC005794]|uniref:hypothetical protein n=1 Tax=Streptomyces sp. NPDC005794 TaxID=3364733 RepID=UPI003683D39A
MEYGCERRELDIGGCPVAQHVPYKLFNRRAGFQRVPVGDLLKLPTGCRTAKGGMTTGLLYYS